MKGFGAINTQAIEEEAKRLSEESQNQDNRVDRRYYNITEGKHTLIILPPHPNAKSNFPDRLVWRHNLPIPTQKREFTSWVCPKKTDPELGYNCPICHALEELEAFGVKGRTFTQCRASANAYYNTIPLSFNAKELDRAKFPYLPHITRLTKQLRDKILVDFLSDPEVGDITNPEHAIPVIITRENPPEGKQDFTKYGITTSTKPRAIADDEAGFEAISSNLYDLWDIFKHPYPKYVNEIEAAAKAVLMKFKGAVASQDPQ